MTADPPHWREVRDRLTAKRDSPTQEPQQRPPAPMTIKQVEAIVSVLDRHKVDYVMIGGIAAELHGAKIARSLDLDVTPAASRANRERIARALAELNATLRVPGGIPDGVEVHIDADWLERVTTATFNTDHGPFDLAFRPGRNRRLRRSGALRGDRPSRCSRCMPGVAGRHRPLQDGGRTDQRRTHAARADRPPQGNPSRPKPIKSDP